MRMARQVRFPRLREPVPGVLLDRAEHPVARCAVALGEQQRFLGQRGEQLEHLLLLDPVAGADPLGRFQARPAGEHREPAQDHPFGVGEQLPAPVDHRAQRPVPRQRGTATAGQQAEPVVETVGELIEGHGAQPGRGQFDRQRHPVQRPADARHRRQRAALELIRDREIPAHRARPVPQQLDGRRGLDLAGAGVPLRQGQRLDQPQRLTGDAERFPARRQDPQPLALPEHPIGERRRRLDHVLTVVQDQQRLPLADRGDEPVRRFGVRRTAEQSIPQAERGERRLRHVTVRADGCELHQPGPVRQVAEQRARGFRGQPGLPRAARPDHGGEPMFGDEFADRGDIGVLADEAGQLGAQVGLPALLLPAPLPPSQLAPQQRDVQCGQLR